MNYYGYEQKSAMIGGCEERERMVVVVESVVCPKPRRLGLLNPPLNEQIRPLRLPVNHHAEMSDSKAGAELLDIILTKGGYGGDKPGFQVASSPPFYCGSPPCRVSNPVIQDARFGNEKITPLSPAPPSPPPSSSSARKGGGCVRMKFGHTPAAVRIEGFDCLRRDGRNCSISAVA
ncbi:hypothetical protein NC652_034711 [Populus alba x Populus x berolinensis]|uniref:Uncharacterized protein n=4 Tax=Populus TaxID=3689 RepID=A0ACC4AXL8_POPAL|nr:uncharacterized protein LOC118037343 [Populus alba]KAG6746858.1 hypothetical protein POTOM_049229 [Populus tomentosa]KAJ6875070.1 hypothetical protein NC652_034711 [Populus alba x Populus x berolinensis]KAJ6970118.1 hypothetical protein NC653_034636 [Populus alba x Populus x berolinensis]TKR90325.1 hypothetical protein D5086_0000234400 [Populus alba]